MKLFLVLAYLSMYGEETIVKHDWTDKGRPSCLRQAGEWQRNLKAGTGRAWCQTVIGTGRPEIIKD